MKTYKIIFYFLPFLFQLYSCSSFVTVQNKGLYDIEDRATENDLNGFTAVDIFKDDYDKSVWVSPETNCVTLDTEKENTYSGSAALHVKWDKVAGNCKWIGIGFGWNNWMAKDLLDLTQTAAIQFQVKAKNGSFKNLPVAFALEDYSNVQVYYGFRIELASGEFNEVSWTTVTIPLSKFNFESKNFDLEKVKQFLIQLEGDGDIYLDNIKIIRLPNG